MGQDERTAICSSRPNCIPAKRTVPALTAPYNRSPPGLNQWDTRKRPLDTEHHSRPLPWNALPLLGIAVCNQRCNSPLTLDLTQRVVSSGRT